MCAVPGSTSQRKSRLPSWPLSWLMPAVWRLRQGVMPHTVGMTTSRLNPAPYRLLVLGGTGLVGQQLLRLALADASITEVVAPVRRPLPARALKMQQPVVDYRQLPPSDWWQADACVCALGTTMKQAGSRTAFAEVDHDFVLAAATRARTAGTPVFVLNSSLGADPAARGFYLQVKGRTEQDLAALGFASLTCVRPSLLEGGPRPDARPAEAAGLWVARVLKPLIPARYQAVRTEAVARHMLAAARAAQPGLRVIESEVLR